MKTGRPQLDALVKIGNDPREADNGETASYPGPDWCQRGGSGSAAATSHRLAVGPSDLIAATTELT
jgi:hypothetical protein